MTVVPIPRDSHPIVKLGIVALVIVGSIYAVQNCSAEKAFRRDCAARSGYVTTTKAADGTTNETCNYP
jgi:hypothetical protein